MPSRGTAVFRVSVRGAGARARDFTRMQRGIQDEIVRELREYGRQAQVIFRGAAPKDTGDLADTIRAVPFFRASRPRVSIRVGPLAGHEGEGRDRFDYLDTTRQGHRTRVIEPQRALALKVHVEGHRNPQIFEFRRAVPGANPRVDWVVAAAERAERVSAVAERRLARRIESRVLR